MKDFLLKLIPPQPWTPALLSWLVVVAALAVYFQLLLFGNPAKLDDLILGRILGTIDTTLGIVIAYWLGSTKAGKEKDETIKNLTGKREVWTDARREAAK